MANMSDLLGAMFKRGMTDSSASRIEHSLGENGIGGAGGILEQLGLAPARETAATQARTEQSSSNPLDALGGLGEIAKSFLGEGSGGKSLAAGGLGALIGALLGGGGKSAKGALGGGALALLGSIALQALRGSQSASQPQKLNSDESLAAGLREPQDAREAEQVQSIVDLTVRAMVNAAKADGSIDEDEMQKIVGELQEDGVTQTERDYLLAEVRKPLNTAEIVRAVPNRQVAAQIYTASLLAIEVDTPAEQTYLENLARDLKLDAQVIRQIHSTLGM